MPSRRYKTYAFLMPCLVGLMLLVLGIWRVVLSVDPVERFAPVKEVIGNEHAFSQDRLMDKYQSLMWNPERVESVAEDMSTQDLHSQRRTYISCKTGNSGICREKWPMVDYQDPFPLPTFASNLEKEHITPKKKIKPSFSRNHVHLPNITLTPLVHETHRSDVAVNHPRTPQGTTQEEWDTFMKEEMYKDRHDQLKESQWMSPYPFSARQRDDQDIEWIHNVSSIKLPLMEITSSSKNQPVSRRTMLEPVPKWENGVEAFVGMPPTEQIQKTYPAVATMSLEDEMSMFIVLGGLNSATDNSFHPNSFVTKC